MKHRNTLLRCILTLALLLAAPAAAMAQTTNVTDVAGLKAISGSGDYVIKNDIDASTGFVTNASFSGTLTADINPATKMPYRIKNLTAPLFTTLSGTVKNLVIESVSISQSGQVGAVACTANGSARIYNVGILGGSVGSTGSSTAADATDCCGGLVGLLDGEARVVNCYSFADITGGNRVAGLVGYNKVATTANKLKTMVFGCMFYGDIDTSATQYRAPVYNGVTIVNKDATGVSNYNYCRAEASYVTGQKVDTGNCALLAETRFLQRFEFFRHLLNGHRELAAWWVSGNAADTALIHKWVMLPDSLGSDHPYPILKKWGRYPSVVNIDAAHAATGQPRNKGGKLDELTVHIQMGSGGAQFAPPHWCGYLHG